jgi:hypothetical protein
VVQDHELILRVHVLQSEESIESLLQLQQGVGRPREVDLREIINGYILRSEGRMPLGVRSTA